MNEETYKILERAIYVDCVNVLYTLTGIFRQNGMEIKAITTDDEERAEILFNNMSSRSFPETEKLNTDKSNNDKSIQGEILPLYCR
jgi:hypothetical protein